MILFSSEYGWKKYRRWSGNGCWSTRPSGYRIDSKSLTSFSLTRIMIGVRVKNTVELLTLTLVFLHFSLKLIEFNERKTSASIKSVKAFQGSVPSECTSKWDSVDNFQSVFMARWCQFQKKFRLSMNSLNNSFDGFKPYIHSAFIFGWNPIWALAPTHWRAFINW